MIDKQAVIAIVEEQLAGSELFLVDVTVSTSSDIEVIVDSESRVSIEDCAVLSRKVEGCMDREVEDFSLTVASAGIGYPFKVSGQYAKCVGRDVEVVFMGGRRVDGVLDAYDESSVTIKYEVKEVIEGSKRKQSVEKLEKIDKTELKSVCEALTIK